MKKMHFTRRRLLSLLLAAVLAAGCMSFMTDTASAESTAPKPDYNGRFEFYSRYFNYYPYSLTGNSYGVGLNAYKPPVPLYIEYSADGKNWKQSGYMTVYMYETLVTKGFEIKGLKPGTRYRTRIYWGDYYGNRISPYRYTGTFRTGMKKKPAVRSVTSKAVNVRFHRTYRSGYYYWTGYHYVWIKGGIMEYYTYDVKVTVRLKKKPGTKGIYVNGRWLRGNKKKYTTTFRIASPYNISVKRPRGNVKYTVRIQSGQSSKWGGYSPTWKKTMKLK